MMPSMTKLDAVYEGCCRAIMAIIFLWEVVLSFLSRFQVSVNTGEVLDEMELMWVSFLR